MRRAYRVVGLGEILWDLLPAGKQLGGAPTNFAYMISLLGDEGIVASRAGGDRLGLEAKARLQQLNLDTEYLQQDRAHPTGTVDVKLDRSGLPQFTIHEDVAWDFLNWSGKWKTLAGRADAVCFGTLAQRSPRSRETILEFLRHTRAGAVRVFDVNLRQSFYSSEVLRESMRLSTIVKMNHDELPIIAKLFGFYDSHEKVSGQHLLRTFNLKLLCITRGESGSLLVSKNGVVEHSGFRVRVADTVGSGDAFTAALVHHYLRGASLDKMNDAANRLGSWVASQTGATPLLTKHDLRRNLAALHEN